ncbi:amidase family protein [Mesorhizobium sp. M0293]|uniref:amidase family protein n=1 Tax=Mesorhizobium sp. M0293 TaxID=2956930 RepID=UPI00333DFF23
MRLQRLPAVRAFCTWGTDGGGSIRIPASFTGIVGHKPTYGRVPAYPPSSFGTVAHIGPMARTVADVAAMLNAMSGHDPKDWTQPTQAFPNVSLQEINWSGKRIGYWSTPCVGGVHPEVAAAVDGVMNNLENADAVVTEIMLRTGKSIRDVLFVLVCWRGQQIVHNRSSKSFIA